jgi:hypothetical protein
MALRGWLTFVMLRPGSEPGIISGMAQEYVCGICNRSEIRCECEKYCGFCQSQMGVRLCEDGQYYCQPCREACDLQVQSL